ncbi:MAG: L-threonylcarbamoyladenylate synthase [Sphaerochaetaceae bacterium]|nr:L-threonylcarbamoyladenylate synthase [Sphaerochaetaceae bacterium]
MILNKLNPETIGIVANLLKDGGLGVLPCDTIYGLSSIYGIGEKPLRFIKKRPDYKPFIILCTLQQAKDICKEEIPEEILKLWPAPLTVILKDKNNVSTAIRVPKDEFFQKLLEKTGSPIYSTSVNTSGEPTLLNFTEIQQRFECKVDFMVKNKETQGTIPSTLIDATVKPYRILRQGTFDVSFLI